MDLSSMIQAVFPRPQPPQTPTTYKVPAGLYTSHSRTHCPYCDSTACFSEDNEYGVHTIDVSMTCNNCHQNWIENFTITSLTMNYPQKETP